LFEWIRTDYVDEYNLKLNWTLNVVLTTNQNYFNWDSALKLIVQCLSEYLFFLFWNYFELVLLSGRVFYLSFVFCVLEGYFFVLGFWSFVSLFWLLYAIKLLIEAFHALLCWIRIFSVFRWWELWILMEFHEQVYWGLIKA